MHAPVLQIWQPVYVRLQSTNSSLKEQLTEKIEFINLLLTRIILQSKMKSLAENTCNLALTLKGAGCNILWHLGEVADCNQLNTPPSPLLFQVVEPTMDVRFSCCCCWSSGAYITDHGCLPVVLKQPSRTRGLPVTLLSPS